MSHRKLTDRMLWLASMTCVTSVRTVKWTHQQLRGSQDIQVQTLDPGVVDPHFSVDPWALNTDQHPEVRGQPGGICRGWVGAVGGTETTSSAFTSSKCNFMTKETTKWTRWINNLLTDEPGKEFWEVSAALSRNVFGLQVHVRKLSEYFWQYSECWIYN